MFVRRVYVCARICVCVRVNVRTLVCMREREREILFIYSHTLHTCPAHASPYAQNSRALHSL